MIDLADMFEEMNADLSGTVSAFPPSRTRDAEHQVYDNKNFSAISAISALEKYRTEFPPQNAAQAGAQARAGARAKEYPVGSAEMAEMAEKPAGSTDWLSASLSRKAEKERECGKREASAGALLANTLAFDERAAFLEYECGLSRADAEAQARVEVGAELPHLCILSTDSARGPVRAAPASAGSLLREWFAGLSLLSPGIIPCPDYRPEEWAAVLANAWGFLNRFGAQAEALDWQTHELWGVHPQLGTIRVDHCGALVLVVGGPVRAITADVIRFERVTYYRRPHAPVGLPIWETAR